MSKYMKVHLSNFWRADKVIGIEFNGDWKARLIYSNGESEVVDGFEIELIELKRYENKERQQLIESAPELLQAAEEVV